MRFMTIKSDDAAHETSVSWRLWSAAASIALLALPISAAPKIRFEQRTVIAEKVTPGGTTTWLAVTHEPQPYHMRVREHARVISDDDRDGVVRFELNRDIPPESVWVVVDMRSGDWTAAEPGTGKIRLKALKAPKISRRESSKAAKLTQEDQHLKFWLIRPGSGAWVQTSVDGGIGDDDQVADGRASAALEGFVPVADSPRAPSDFARNDIVIVVDPLNLALFEQRVRD